MIDPHMSICQGKNKQNTCPEVAGVARQPLPPTELWLEQPATVRERTGSGSLKGMAAGMQTQTVLLAPPSTPRMTLPMRGLWHSSTSHISLPVYLCIFLSASTSLLLHTRKRRTPEESSPATYCKSAAEEMGDSGLRLVLTGVAERTGVTDSTGKNEMFGP